MLLDGCSSNFITLPYAFVFFDWFSLHWWKWIYVQSQQCWFYLWQMEFESVCCFNNLLLRNCLSFADHYKAASTRSRKQINCVFRWKFEGKYPKSGSIITYSAAGAFWKIVYPSFNLPIKKIFWGFYSQLKVSASYFLKMGLKNNFLHLYVNCTIVCQYNKEQWKIFPKYENCGPVTTLNTGDVCFLSL